tara:strand:- start:170 stop:658 length:489 start_codon:yes stop_codon:yes gene_type:complete
VERYEEFNLESQEHCFFKELRNFTMHISHLPLISHKTYKEKNIINFESFKKTEFNKYLEKEIKKHPKWNCLKLARVYSKKVENTSLNELFKIYDVSMRQVYNRTVLNFIRQNHKELFQILSTIKNINLNLNKNGITSNHTLNPIYIRYVEILLKKSLYPSYF